MNTIPIEEREIWRRKPAQLRFTLYRDIEAEPQKLWLVHDYLGAGELSCIFGPPGSGKSVFAGDLAAHVAAGRTWFGRRVQSGAVLYVAIECAALVKRRLAAFREHHMVSEIPLAVVSGQVDLRTSQESAEEIIEYARRIGEIGEVPTSLILIDTVSRALAGGDENSPKDMGSLVGNLAHIQEQTGAHVAALHHIPADGTQRLRGHGALLGACDTTIKVESLNGCRAGTVDKVNDGPDGERVAFELKTVELHFDPETNTTTTAPVVIPADAPTIISSGPNLSPNQRSALNLLETQRAFPKRNSSSECGKWELEKTDVPRFTTFAGHSKTKDWHMSSMDGGSCLIRFSGKGVRPVVHTYGCLK